MSNNIYLYRVPIRPWRQVEILKVEVTRFTDKTFWTKTGTDKERSHSRFTKMDEFYESYEEAKQARIALADKEILELKKQINSLSRDVEAQRQYKLIYLSDKTLESELEIDKC